MNFLKSLAFPVGLITVAFIGFGDRILPSPLSTFSLNARNTIVQTLTGATPQLKPQKPYAETEKAVDNLSQ